MKTAVTIVALCAALSAAAVASPLQLKGSQFLPQAKVTLAQARRTALAKEHGSIVDQELEKENGGLRYSFDVKVGKTMHEVGVDAVTGKIVEDSIDNGND
ncbi:MAG TPA: PepSY domain-containing protein [Candidatus Aquilonibacter sp.]|nr:PepSY domain-containing protein [Candidatus Aquilonibacter sp.]